VAADQLVPMPAGVSFEQAASLPVAYGTAHRMLITHKTVNKGERVLVLGASGGVGTGCVILAKLLGAEVIACASSDEKLRRLKEMGADEVVDYTKTTGRSGRSRNMASRSAAPMRAVSTLWSTSRAGTPGTPPYAVSSAAVSCSFAARPRV